MAQPKQKNHWKTDYAMMNLIYSDTTWKETLHNADTLTSHALLYEKVYYAIDETVPPGRKKRKSKYSKKYRKLRNEKNKLKKSIKNSRYPRKQMLKEILTRKDKQMRTEIQKDIVEEENFVLENMKNNPNLFYHHINKKKKNKSAVLPVIDPATNLPVTDPTIAASLLAEQYEQVYTNPEQMPTIPDDRPAVSIDTIEITVERFERALKCSKENLAAGPDNIPSIILSQCAKTLAEPSTIVWKKSFENTIIPPIHLQGVMNPVLKKNPRRPVNFRPIMLLPNFLKAFERLIAEQLVEYLEKNNLLNTDQFGFRKNRSTTGKLLASIDKITEQLAKNQPFDTILLDMSKAFDKISIAKIIEAAMNIGIRGKLLLWIKEYLTGRTAVVKIGDTLSRPIQVTSGVPQGSVLGPILFLIAINGLPQNCPERELLLSYADDTEVGGVATNHTDIQRTLDLLNQHCSYLKLEMNADKCEVMHRGANNNCQNYTIGDITLPKVSKPWDNQNN